MKIHIPKKLSPGKRWYCGPHAFAVIAGTNFETTRSILNRQRGRPTNQGIRGYPTIKLVGALVDSGYQAEEQIIPWRIRKDLNFKAWLKDGVENEEAFYLLELTQHFVVVKRGLFIDNFSGHCVSTIMCPHLRKRVKRVFEITSREHAA